ncbi:MAG TPA: CsgG/HfaB family protein [Holophagaceae bacterium]|jgi:curli biogenesis system outer membrane secretion channel CsgG|nr:CsgG/HfaB family protein [Holophagaceae bacterium]
MKLRHLLLSLAATLAAAVPASAASKAVAAPASGPRMAILDFKAAPGCWAGWRFGGWGNNMDTISDQLRDLFTTEIVTVSHKRLRLIERERLQDIRNELQFQQSGEVDTSTVLKIGKLLGVQFVMTGKVTRFAYKESGVKTGWGVGALVGRITGDSTAGAVAGSVNVHKASFTGRLDIRLIDIQTGEILGAWTDDGKVADHSVEVAGTGTEMSYDEELVNKVFEPVVQRLTPKLVNAALQAYGDGAGN